MKYIGEFIYLALIFSSSSSHFKNALRWRIPCSCFRNLSGFFHFFKTNSSLAQCTGYMFVCLRKQDARKTKRDLQRMERRVKCFATSALTSPWMRVVAKLGPLDRQDFGAREHRKIAPPVPHTMATLLVPTDWKMANITWIFKNGQRNVPTNYRPNSLTRIVRKIFGSITVEIITHLEDNLLTKSQHDFIKIRSYLINLLQFLDTVTYYVDQGFPVDVIYLDFQKALS